MIIATLLTAGGLVLCKLFVKQEKWKRFILKVFAILTVVLHFSILYVDFFTYGKAEVASPLLLPIYPCNVLMWLLVICAFIKNPKTKVAKVLFEFTFYAGVVCGIIGIVLNENFASNPTLANWFSLRGLLSHSTMVFGCIYILVGGFIRLDITNCISVFAGLCLFLIDGLIINGLYHIFGLGDCNSMYLQANPFPSMPWLNTYVMGIAGMLVVFIISNLCELITLEKQDRFLVKCYNKVFKNSIKDGEEK